LTVITTQVKAIVLISHCPNILPDEFLPLALEAITK
jgi:hypothetical protein